MPAPTVLATDLEYAGVAKEATPGTPITPVMTMPFKTFEWEDVATILEDTSTRGSFAETYDLVIGPVHSEWSMSGPAYLDALPFLLANIMGEVATTGAGPYTHAITTLNSGQPITHTLTDWRGLTTTVGARALPGVVVNELTLTWGAEGLFAYDAKGLGWQSAAAASTPSKTMPPRGVLAVWAGTINQGGSQIKNVTDAEMTLMRKTRIINTVQGVQAPFAIVRSSLGAKGKFSIVAADDTPLTTMLAATQQQLVIALGTSPYSISVNVQKGAYSKSKGNNSKEDQEWDVEWTAIGNTTDVGTSAGFGMTKVTIINAQPASTYS